MKLRPRKGSWVLFIAALVAMFSPLNITKAEPINILVNGDFSVNGGGWSGATTSSNGSGGGCAGATPSMGAWAQNALTFSYLEKSVTQSVVVPSAGPVNFSVSVRSDWGGTYSVTIDDSNETATTGVQTAVVAPTSISLNLTTTSDNENVNITISGKDSLFWAGCYGPMFTNAALNVLVPIPDNRLNVDVYTVDNGDYSPTADGRTLCTGAWTYVENINYDWGGGAVAGCRNDAVLIKYYGSITVPGTEGEIVNVRFSNITDDGHRLIVNGELLIDDWNFKPCSGGTAEINLIAGQKYPFESWFVEAGGGACNYLY